MKPAYSRAALGAVLALGMLSFVPGVAFAAAPSCGDTLTANTTLHADLDCSGYAGTALTLGKKGITLDLNGYEIIGPNGDNSYYGVYDDGYKNVTVKHGKISGYYYGVYFYAVVNGTIKNLTITGDTDNSGVSSNDYGVYLDYGARNTLDNITVSAASVGLGLNDAAQNSVMNSHVSGAQYSYYFYLETSDTIVGNSATDYTNYSSIHDDGYGFYDYYFSANQTYKNNTADGNDAVDTIGFYLYCDDAGPVTLINNSATGNTDEGFYSDDCYDDYNYIDGKVSVFSGNTAWSNPGYGFYDDYSIHAVWTNNVAKNNGSDGFYLDYPGAVTFNNNVAKHNDGDGIYLGDNYSGNYGNLRQFNNNVANNNNGYGIEAEYGLTNYSGNIAHGNVNAPENCHNLSCN